MMKLNVRNASGGMVPLSSFATADRRKGDPQIVGYNGYPTIRITGEAAVAKSSGATMVFFVFVLSLLRTKRTAE